MSDYLQWLARNAASEFKRKRPTLQDVLRYAAVAFAAGEKMTTTVSPPDLKKRFTQEQRVTHWKAIDRIATSWEKKFAEGSRKAFKENMREILSIVSEAKRKALTRKASIAWEDSLLEVNDYLAMAGSDSWRQTFVPLVQGVVTAQGERWAEQLGMQFSVRNLFAEAWFDDYMLTFSQPINDTTRSSMRTMFAQAQAEGWSFPEMQNHLETMFRQWSYGDVSKEEFEWYAERFPSYRTEAIARTETMRSSNAGTTELFREWGVRKRAWLSTQDDRTREDHLGADGQEVAMDEAFDVGGEALMFPGDPAGSPENTINCRCTTIPIIEGD